MLTKIINSNDRADTFNNLFGMDLFKRQMLYVYAETLFYCGMDQMVSGYTGGYFDFVQIQTDELETEPNGFIPLMSDKSIVELVSPYGVTQNLSIRAACLVVWIFVVEQIAHNASHRVQKRLFNTVQDLKSFYSELVDENGDKLFSVEDCSSIYTLLD
jgi:hypothetical protein